MTLTNPVPRSSGALLTMLLPGPDRKRMPATYRFRVAYRNPAADETGCVMAWEVGGGRTTYQVALERKPNGDLRWHCSCADAVYRGEGDPAHECKHVRGLIDNLPPVSPPTRQAMAA